MEKTHKSLYVNSSLYDQVPLIPLVFALILDFTSYDTRVYTGTIRNNLQEQVVILHVALLEMVIYLSIHHCCSLLKVKFILYKIFFGSFYIICLRCLLISLIDKHKTINDSLC